MLVYHQQTAEMIAQRIAAGKSSVCRMDLVMRRPYSPQLCDDWESVHGVPLPESVREWYTQPNALELLYHGFHRNHDPLYPDQFQLEHGVGPDGSGRVALTVIEEEIGCCVWGAALDGSADPPGVTRWNVDETDPAPERRWWVCAPTFSNLLATLIDGSRSLYPNCYENQIYMV